MSAFSDLFKKAHDAINNLRGGGNVFLGKEGDIVFSKNNVCIHDIEETGNTTVDGNILHTPGYLTVHCQNDDAIGVTLVLQWLPNTTLQKNPASIRSVSPRKQNVTKKNSTEKSQISSCADDASSCTEEECSLATTVTSPDIHVEMNGDVITVTSVQDRPNCFQSKDSKTSVTSKSVKEKTGNGSGLFVPSINVIPHTPVDPTPDLDYEKKVDSASHSSLSTSGADELSDREDLRDSSSCDESEDEDERSQLMNKYREECASLLSSTPERFAIEHDLMLTDCKAEAKGEAAVAISRGRAMFNSKSTSTSLFSVNLGKMRTMRVFFSNAECTSGQMVIASHDSHYKILHFHHGGLDKLAELFEQWSVIKTKSLKDGSPSPIPDKHWMICQPAVKKSELDPEDGLYDKVTWDFWKSYTNKDGAIDDSHTISKAIYFASMEPALRKEIWPFLLRVYPWESTLEQRETIRNDLFLEYQNIRKKRMKKASSATGKAYWDSLENTVSKDVVRTDRGNPFFAQDDNPNLDMMKNILLNYACVYPDINYIQGMSDLLAPLLSTLRDEAESYWCFSGLMQQTLFAVPPKANESLLEHNLDYLRELLKLLVPDVFRYFSSIGSEALQLMFVHRWILLFFKREFPEADALHIWEACWSRFRTRYFHLFVCVAIVSIYGPDVISQQLPHDEILLYFSSLAMHMDARVVLKKARGLLYEFIHREHIPCTLAGLCEQTSGSKQQWDSHRQPQSYKCVKVHENHEPCPFT